MSIIANNIDKGAHHFRIEKTKNDQEIKVNGIARRIFYYFQSSHKEKIFNLVEKNVKTAEALEKASYQSPGGEATELFIAAQRYNQTVANRNVLLKLIGHDLKLIRHEGIPELNPSKIIANRPEKNPVEELANDKPIVQTKKRVGKNHKVKRYPGDDKDHGTEAGRIFINTQKERLLSTIGGVCESVAKLFGSKVKTFEKYHYNKDNERESKIYSADSPLLVREPANAEQVNKIEPTSYWLGHATLLLNIPLKSENGSLASFNVITDPVEGDLNAILYPRQTKFARSMEKTPKTDVYLLSDNHLDHYSKATIKKTAFSATCYDRSQRRWSAVYQTWLPKCKGT